MRGPLHPAALEDPSRRFLSLDFYPSLVSTLRKGFPVGDDREAKFLFELFSPSAKRRVSYRFDEQHCLDSFVVSSILLDFFVTYSLSCPSHFRRERRRASREREKTRFLEVSDYWVASAGWFGGVKSIDPLKKHYRVRDVTSGCSSFFPSFIFALSCCSTGVNVANISNE